MSQAPEPPPSPPSGPVVEPATPRNATRKNPWWIPPFLGRVPAVSDTQLKLLGIVSLAMLFESYDQSMLTAALKQIAESLGVAESDLGGMLGFVHGGAVAAFVIVPFADHIGRRRLFLASLIGLSVATALTAFAQTVWQFVLLQMISRTFMVSCSATAYVIVTEEFPAAHRGWGVGMIGALAAFGYGLGMLLFAAIDVLPYGWRTLYFVGVIPLLALPMFRRRIPETARFRKHALERTETGWLEPLVRLARTYPGRFAAVGAIGVLGSAGGTVGFVFSAFHVQSVHGWSPGQYSAMAFLAGTVGIIGHPWAGRVADRRGRRLVGFLLHAVYPATVLAFYNGPGWTLPIAWIPMIFCLTGGGTITRALATELFPTSHRGSASGWLQLTEAAGRSAGLFIVALGTMKGASNVPMINLVVFASLVAGLVILLLPETGRRELEEISGE